MSKHWYYLKVDQRKGPVTAEELSRLAAAGRLQPSDLVMRSGAKVWLEVGQIAALEFGPAPADSRPPARGPLPIRDGDPLAVEHLPLTAGQQLDFWYTHLPNDQRQPRLHLFEREEWLAPGLVKIRIGSRLVEADGRLRRAFDDSIAELLTGWTLTVHRRLHAGFIEEKCDFLDPDEAAFEPILKLGAQPGDTWEFKAPNDVLMVFVYLGHHVHRGQLTAVVECTEYSDFDIPWTVRRCYVPGKGLWYQEWEEGSRRSAIRSRIDHRRRFG